MSGLVHVKQAGGASCSLTRRHGNTSDDSGLWRGCSSGGFGHGPRRSVEEMIPQVREAAVEAAARPSKTMGDLHLSCWPSGPGERACAPHMNGWDSHGSLCPHCSAVLLSGGTVGIIHERMTRGGIGA